MEKNSPIIGKRVILFPLEIVDLDHFIKLHREDRNGMMGRFCLREMSEDEARRYILTLLSAGEIRVFTVMSKEGKASKKVGYIYLSDISSFSCNVVGILDKEFAQGLTKMLRRTDKYTFSEDALRTMCAWCFNGAGFKRIEYRTFERNRLSMRLAEKAGFIREGRLRESFKVGDELLDVVLYALLKSEADHGRK